MLRLISPRKSLTVAVLTSVCSLWNTATVTPKHHLPDPPYYAAEFPGLLDRELPALPKVNEWLHVETGTIVLVTAMPAYTESNFSFASLERDVQYAWKFDQVKTSEASDSATTVDSIPEITYGHQTSLGFQARRDLPLKVNDFTKYNDDKYTQLDADWNGNLPAYFNGGRFVEFRRNIEMDDDASIVREKKLRIPIGEDVELLVESRINDNLESGKSYGVGVGLKIKF